MTVRWRVKLSGRPLFCRRFSEGFLFHIKPTEGLSFNIKLSENCFVPQKILRYFLFCGRTPGCILFSGVYCLQKTLKRYSYSQRSLRRYSLLQKFLIGFSRRPQENSRSPLLPEDILCSIDTLFPGGILFSSELYLQKTLRTSSFLQKTLLGIYILRGSFRRILYKRHTFKRSAILQKTLILFFIQQKFFRTSCCITTKTSWLLKPIFQLYS